MDQGEKENTSEEENIGLMDEQSTSEDSDDMEYGTLGRGNKEKNPQETMLIEEKRLPCPDCKKTFANLSGLRGHQRFCAAAVPDHVLVLVKPDPGEDVENKEVKAVDPLADAISEVKYEISHADVIELNSNKEQFEGVKVHSCQECNKLFKRRFDLERHFRQAGCNGYSVSPYPTYPCQVCERTFNRKDNLTEHMRVHAGVTRKKKMYSCKYCNNELRGLARLQIHMRTHTGEKPYQCDRCYKRFISMDVLRKHYRMHTGERPYECKQCAAKFAAKETLNRHVRTHTGAKPHSCKYCEKSFIQPAQLREHLFYHTGENGFSCELCGKAFNRKSRLAAHAKYHEQEKSKTEMEQSEEIVIKEEFVSCEVAISNFLLE